MQQRFARVANPDLVMVVYPHLARGKYPVPGYVTVFPMYESTEYAMPGESTEDLQRGRAAFSGRAGGGRPANEHPRSDSGWQGQDFVHPVESAHLDALGWPGCTRCARSSS